MASREQETGTGTALQSWESIQVGASLDIAKWPVERLQAVWNTLAPEGAKAGDMVMFLSLCDRYDLDPFAREIWLVKDERQKIIVLAERDAFLKIARRYPEYLGYRSGIVHAKDEFSLEVDSDNPNVRVVHKINAFDRGELVGAYCIGYWKDRPPVWAIRRLEEYSHLKGKNNWKNYTADMIETRVITAVHRRLVNLSGLYAPQEFIAGELDPDVAQGPAPDVQSERTAQATRSRLADLKERMKPVGRQVDEIQEAEFEVVQEQAPTPAPAAAAAPAEPKPNGNGKKGKAKGRFFALVGELGWSDFDRKSWQEQHGLPASAKDFTDDDYARAIQMIEAGETEFTVPEPASAREPGEDDDDAPLW